MSKNLREIKGCVLPGTISEGDNWPSSTGQNTGKGNNNTFGLQGEGQMRGTS